MEAKEKAAYLVVKYMSKVVSQRVAIECALVAVDEIINTLNYDIRDLDVIGSVLLDLITYWREVKQEIEKL